MIPSRISDLREKCRNGFYRKNRTTSVDLEKIRDEVRDMGVYEALSRAFKKILDAETPVIIKGERLQFTRTTGNKIYTIVPENNRVIKNASRVLPIENLAPDYGNLLAYGMENRLRLAEQELTKCSPESEEYEFLSSVVEMLENSISFAERYAKCAEEMKEFELAALLRKVPRYPAETLNEALQSVYFYSAMLRLASHIHIGFGRFDQYIIDFYRNDIASGRETPESAKELLAEFFLAICRDYDLYPGVQTGDNGQSMVLGGCKKDGSSAENELTLLLMDISSELKMIDPKINLRIDRNTSQECLKSAADLSGCGLGFPQYNNDEVIIPGLVDFGYSLEDARNYSVAACWEFVVKNGRDVPNIHAVNLAFAANRAIRYVLENGLAFEDIKTRLKYEIKQIVDRYRKNWNTYFHIPGPLISAFEENCLLRHKDLNAGGGDHYHYGFHGCGSSTAADSIAAVKQFVFDEKSVSASEMLAALENDFEGNEPLRLKLKNAPCKVGCSSKDADDALKMVFDCFARILGEIEDNGRGGKVRPGTGSAMFYVWFTQDRDRDQYLKATADGRKEGEYISSSLAPAPGVKADGMLSILESYSKIDYMKVCNGGPVTMEFDPICFSSDAAKEKMTMLIRAFVNSKCQQLQWNVLDPEVLRHAQKFPEQHRDLVVRVWGWSGFFVELDKVYQDQIIGRTSYKG